MGQWETERGRGSDAMADILGEALRQIGLLRDEYSLLDLADAIEFTTRGMLLVELHKDAPDENIKHLSLAVVLHNSGLFKTIPNRGQIKGRCQEGGGTDAEACL